MQERSSSSARIRWANKEQVLSEIRALVEEMAREHPELLGVILFGSYATDRYLPSSDVDLLLVLADSPLPFPDRIPRYLPERFPYPVDCFPYTVREIHQERGAALVRSALEHGSVLFWREGYPPLSESGSGEPMNGASPGAVEEPGR